MQFGLRAMAAFVCALIGVNSTIAQRMPDHTLVVTPPATWSGSTAIDVSISGNVAAVAMSGQETYSPGGAVGVFRWNGSAWIQEARFAAAPYHPLRVRVDGDLLAIHRVTGPSPVRQFVDLYHWDGATWVSEGSLLYSAGHTAAALYRPIELTLSESSLVIASLSPSSTDPNVFRDSIDIYERAAAGTWSLATNLTRDSHQFALNTDQPQFYGPTPVRVARKGEVLVLGSRYNEDHNPFSPYDSRNFDCLVPNEVGDLLIGSDACCEVYNTPDYLHGGAADTYRRTSTGDWGDHQQRRLEQDSWDAQFGAGIATNGSEVAISSPRDRDGWLSNEWYLVDWNYCNFVPPLDTTRAGSVTIYSQNGQTQRIRASNSTAQPFGTNVALTDDLLVIEQRKDSFNHKISHVYRRGPAGTWDLIDQLRGGLPDLSAHSQFVSGKRVILVDSTIGKHAYVYDLQFGCADPDRDTDQDGLKDCWETEGGGLDVNNDGIIDLDLYALGARPDHRDIFVEIDGTDPTSVGPDHQTQFDEEALELVVAAFNNAPLLNPDGTYGIRLHADRSESPIPYSINNDHTNQLLSWYRQFLGTPSDRDPNNVNRAHIVEAKKRVFRWCAMLLQPEDDDTQGLWVPDTAAFWVALEGSAMSDADNGVYNRAAVFMHELGHSLGLKHGGSSPDLYIPNYVSVMNYSCQYRHNRDAHYWRLDYSRTSLGQKETATGDGEIVRWLDEEDLDETAGIDGRGIYDNVLMPIGYAADPADPHARGVRYVKLDGSPIDFGGTVDFSLDGQINVSAKQDLNFLYCENPDKDLGCTDQSPQDLLVGTNDWNMLKYEVMAAPNTAATPPRISRICAMPTFEVLSWLHDNHPPAGVNCNLSIPPTFTVSPQSTCACPDEMIELTAVATGTDPLRYQWFKDRQPIAGAESNRLILNTIAEAAGSYTVKVSNDCAFAFSRSATVTLRPAPTSNAGIDEAVVEGTTVRLDGSGSANVDCGTPVYTWTQIAGDPVLLDLSDAIRPTFQAPPVPIGGATLTFQLVVSSGRQFSEPDFVNITISNVNHPPVAQVDGPTAVAEGGLGTLDGSTSYDVDEDPLSYTWTQTAGIPVDLVLTNPQKPTFVAPFVGPAGATVSFALTVSDTLESSTTTINVVIRNVNQMPLADAGQDQTVAEGTLVTLSASASSDPDGDSLTFYWSQISGPAVSLNGGETASPSLVTPQVGGDDVELTFQVAVADGYGGFSTDTITLTVQNTGAPPVCELALPSVSELWPPNHKLVPVSISAVTPTGNNNVVISITEVTQDEPTSGLGDGDTAPDAIIQGGTVLLRAERSGTGNGRVYRITFEARDNSGGICTGTVSVSVPHSKGKNGSPAIDNGQSFNSLAP